MLKDVKFNTLSRTVILAPPLREIVAHGPAKSKHYGETHRQREHTCSSCRAGGHVDAMSKEQMNLTRLHCVECGLRNEKLTAVTPRGARISAINRHGIGCQYKNIENQRGVKEFV